MNQSFCGTTKSFFPLGVYWPWGEKRTGVNAQTSGLDVWGYTGKMMTVLREHHVNLVWVIHMPVDDLSRFCDIAGENEIKVLASTDIEDMLSDYSPVTIDRVVSGLVEKWRNLNALVGYVGFDEPKGMDMQVVNQMQEAFNRYDPTRFFTVVTRPHEAPLAMHHLNAEQLCIDPYPFFHEQAPWYDDNSQKASKERHLERLENVAYLRDKYQKNCWFMPQAFAEFAGAAYWDPDIDRIAILPGSFINWRMPTEDEFSWLVWSAVARGYNGIIPFVLLPGNIPDKEGFLEKHGEDYVVESNEWWAEKSNVKELTYIDKNTALITCGLTPSPQMKKMSQIYAMLAPLGNLLASAKPIYPLAFSEKPFYTKTFISSDMEVFAVIVNEDLDNNRNEEVGFLPAIKGGTDLLTGKEITVNRTNDNAEYGIAAIELASGAGTVIRLETEALTHSLLVSFDFSAIEAQDQPLGKRVNCKLINTTEGTGVPGLQPDDEQQPAYLEYDFRETFAKKLSPDQFRGNIYMSLEGNKLFEISLLNESGQEQKKHLCSGYPVIIPRETKCVRIYLTKTDAILTEISLIYAK